MTERDAPAKEKAHQLAQAVTALAQIPGQHTVQVTALDDGANQSVAEPAA
jgi:predicted choloylglycine hydrolase